MANGGLTRGMICELQILLYTCLLLKVTRPHIKNPLAYAAKASKKNCSKIVLKVQRQSIKSFQEKIKPLGVECDFNSTVIISPKTAIYLSARNCQWATAKFYVEDSEGFSNSREEKNFRKRWILLHISSEIPEDICFVSPILYHNIGYKDGLELAVEFANEFQYIMSAFQKISVLWQNAHNPDTPIKENVIHQSSPYYAMEVHVKYVESMKYKCGNAIEALISDYFSLPKTVTLNDIIVIPLPSHLAFDFATSNCIFPPRYVFIKVCSVKGKTGKETWQTMLVKKDVTRLYLSGATKCSLPSLSSSICLDDKGETPPVLANDFKKFKSLLEMEKNNKQHHIGDEGASSSICIDCKENEPGLPCLQNETRTDYQISSNLISDDDAFKSEAKANSSVLYIGSPGNGLKEILNLVASAMGIEVLWTESWHLKGDTSGTTEARIRQTFLRASTQCPCILVLENVHCLAKDHDGNDDGRVVGTLREELSKLPSDVFLVGTAPHRFKVSADLWSIWSHQETVEIPNLNQRGCMLTWLFSTFVPKVKIQALAQRTAGYMFGDFQALFAAAQRLCLQRLYSKEGHKDLEMNQSVTTTKGLPPLEYEDILQALDELQSNRSEALGAPRIPQVRWKEVGGLEDAKREVVNTIQLPLRHPSLVSSGLRRSGVLLYGPPGTGKTLLAKAVATECGLNFMSVKGPELLNMYVGQSEENVRQVFSRARAAAPCVIFFDELDSLAPNRGRSGDSGGVMDRIVSALLAELDGVANTSDVFVMAATNRPDLIDPALLRPGRFEKLVFLGVCEDRASQIKILKAVTSKIPVAENEDLEEVVKELPLTLTGADLYALCVDALYVALQRTTEDIVVGKVKEENAEISVKEEDFKTAAEQLVPSVTTKDLTHYKNLNTNKR